MYVNTDFIQLGKDSPLEPMPAPVTSMNAFHLASGNTTPQPGDYKSKLPVENFRAMSPDEIGTWCAQNATPAEAEQCGIDAKIEGNVQAVEMLLGSAAGASTPLLPSGGRRV